MISRTGVAAAVLAGCLWGPATGAAGEPGLDLGVDLSLLALNGWSVTLGFRSEGPLGGLLQVGQQSFLDFDTPEKGLLVLTGVRLGTDSGSGDIPAFLQVRAGMLRFPDRVHFVAFPGVGIDTSWGPMAVRFQVDWPLLLGRELSRLPRISVGAVYRLGELD